MGRLPWSGDRTNNYHREGVFLGLEGIRVKLPLEVTRAYTLPGRCVLTLGGLGFSLSASVAGARIARRGPKGEVVGQYRPPRLYPHRFAVGLFGRFVIGRG